MPEKSLRTRGRGEQVVLLPLQAEDALDIVITSNGGNTSRITNGNRNANRNANKSSGAKRGSSYSKPSLAELLLLVGSAFFLLMVLKTARSKHFLAPPAPTISRYSPLELLEVKRAAHELLGLQKADLSLRKERPTEDSVSLASANPVAARPTGTSLTNATAKTTTAATNSDTVSVAGIDPIPCANFLESVRLGTYPVAIRDPNKLSNRQQAFDDADTFNQTNFTRMTLTENPFWISVHHRIADRVRWTMYKEGKYYEWALEKLWRNILKESGPGARILDVGYVYT
jgi:hypothetical protein